MHPGRHQDTDSLIRYIGFTQNGELGNVQYIGFLDKVAIYDRALSEAEVRLHAQAVRNADTDVDTFKDSDEIALGTNPTVASSKPSTPESWEAAVNADAPIHWLTFEESSVAEGIIDRGSLGWNTIVFGPGMTDAESSQRERVFESWHRH